MSGLSVVPNKKMSYYEVYELGGASIDLFDPVAECLRSKCRTGTSTHQLQDIADAVKSNDCEVTGVLYGLRDGGLIEGVEIDEKSGLVRFCVESGPAMSARIDAQSNDDWLADHAAAESL